MRIRSTGNKIVEFIELSKTAIAAYLFTGRGQILENCEILIFQ